MKSELSQKITHLTDAMKSTLGQVGEGGVKEAAELKGKLGEAAEGLAKEAESTPQLHEQALGALQRMQEEDSSLRSAVHDAYAYAVFPSAARASAVVGVTYGKGEVFEKGHVIGYAGAIQITAGVQLGGEVLDILVLMQNEDALKLFKSGKISFAANASAALVKAGAIAGRSPSGLRVLLYSEGGEVLEAAIGGQTFKFVPAALGRLRHGPEDR